VLHFIPTPIGNLEDISFRCLKLIETAEIVFCEDTRVTKKLISKLCEKYKISTNIKKFISLHSHNEKEILAKIDPSIFEKNTLYMSDAGVPAISDPGAELADFCIKNKIDYEVLPGANAALLAFAASGFKDTKFLFFGFLPHKGKERQSALEEAMNCGYTAIVYESPHRIKKLINQIVAIDSEREIFAIKEATKLYEKKFRLSAKQMDELLKNLNLKGEWTVVIKGEKKSFCAITPNDILELSLPKKQTAKLLSKITGRSVKELYQEMI
jgi:16S rRNA (cytidine1402-2'-O)-methyltransferase